MDEKFLIEFPTCPNCGCEETFMNEVSELLKKKGWVKPEMKAFFDIKEGTLIDPSRLATIPVGSNIPGFQIASDICVQCGTFYAKSLKVTGRIFEGVKLQSGQLN